MSTSGDLATIAQRLSAAVSRAVAGGDPDCRTTATASQLDQTDDLVVVLDTEGNVRAFNRACAEASGFAIGDVRGRPFWESLAVPNEQDSFRAMVGMVVESGTPCQFEGHLRTTGGESRPANWAFRGTDGESGVAERVLLIGRLSQRGHAGGAPSGRDRRRSVRRVFRYVQPIAPWDEETPPPASGFFEVECRDISAGGFSFFLTQRPQFRELVVALGKPPNVTYCTAEVRQIREQERDGRQGYLVGCQFRGRLDR